VSAELSDSQTMTAPELRLPSLNVEQGLYLSIMALGAVLRLGQLSHLPLNPDEAQQALSVWQYWQPGTAGTVSNSPAYFALTSPLTQVMGFGEAVMRLVPALFSLAVLGLPYLLRHRLGRFGAMVAALLLATSAAQVLYGRAAGGQAIAMFAGGLVLVAWMRFRDARDRRWTFVLAAALGLGLASSAQFYSLILGLAVAWLLQRLLGPRFVFQQEAIPLLDRALRRQLALVGTAVFLGLGTAFLLSPGGIGAAGEQLIRWLAQFGVAEPSAWPELLGGFLRYELFIALFIAPATIWAARTDRPFGLFLAYWLMASILVTIAQRALVDGLALWTMPAYMLIGLWANDILKVRTGPYGWPAFGVVLVAGGALYANLVRFVRLAPFPEQGELRFHLILVLVLVLVALAALVLLANWHGTGTRQGALLGLLAILLLQSWGTAWWMGVYGAADPREPWVARAADDELLHLAATFSQLSWQVTNSAGGLETISLVDSPSLKWYLRDATRFTQATALAPGTGSLALLTPSGVSPELDGAYFGADFGYERTATRFTLDALQYLRWWLFHELPVAQEEQRLILWIRTDLVGGA
jgi:hypothetical protein